MQREQKFIVAGNTAILFCPSSNGKVFGVRIDAEDLGRVLALGYWSVANFDAARSGTRLYCYSCKDKRIVYLHRFILDAPKGLEVDHSHNRSLDNSKSEIRLASKSLNQRNKGRSGPPNRLGLRGVRVSPSGRFVARVWINNKAKQLGTFATPEQAGEVVREFLIAQGAGYAAGVA